MVTATATRKRRMPTAEYIPPPRKRNAPAAKHTPIGVYMDELEFKFVWCKTIGHGWEEFFPLMRRAQFGHRLSLLCSNCTTERHDIIRFTDGQLLQREYRYPEGYKMAQKYTKDEFRKVLLQRIRNRDRKARAG